MDDDWKFVSEYPIAEYVCGARSGDRVRLRRDLVIRDHKRRSTGKVHPAGEVWTVVNGSAEEPPVVWLRQADGRPHTWDDTDEFWECFERVE